MTDSAARLLRESRENPPADIEIVYRLVLGGCGCWWVENVPPGLVTDPVAARVCSKHRSSHSASRYPSPQGMAMVSVVYVTDEAAVEAARELMWR